MKNSEKKLRKVLKINGVFSLFCGIFLSLFSHYISELFAIENSIIIMSTGIGLVFFSTTVFYAAIKRTISSLQVKLIIVQDLAWVIGNSIIFVFQLFNLSSTGYGLIVAVAFIIVTFAILQTKYLKQVRSS